MSQPSKQIELILHVPTARVGTVLEVTSEYATLVSALPVPDAPRPAPRRRAPTQRTPDPPAAPAPTPDPPGVRRDGYGRLVTPKGEKRGESLVLEFMRAAKGPVLASSIDRVLMGHGYAPGGGSARLSTLKKQGLVIPLGDGKWALKGHTTVHMGAAADRQEKPS